MSFPFSYEFPIMSFPMIFLSEGEPPFSNGFPMLCSFSQRFSIGFCEFPHGSPGLKSCPRASASVPMAGSKAGARVIEALNIDIVYGDIEYMFYSGLNFRFTSPLVVL